jgi:hypothetical protein
MALFHSWTWSTPAVASALLALYVVYVFGVTIHRLYFSRYAKFPGPKLAGLTYGYMFYYDAIGGKGQYMHRIKEMHEEYSRCNLCHTLHSPFSFFEYAFKYILVLNNMWHG